MITVIGMIVVIILVTDTSKDTSKINSGKIGMIGFDLKIDRLVGLELWEPEESKILADTLTLFQSEGGDYVHHITTRPPPLPDLQIFLRFWVCNL